MTIDINTLSKTSFSAPYELNNLYNSNQITTDELLTMSTNYYRAVNDNLSLENEALKAANAELAEANLEVEELKDENVTLNLQNQNLKSKIAEALQKATSVDATTAAYKKKLNDLSALVAQLEAQLKQQASDHASQLEKAKNDNKALKSELSAANNKLKNADASLEELRKQGGNSHAEVEKLQKQLAHKTEDFRVVKAEVEDLKDMRVNDQKVLNSTRETLEQATKQAELIADTNKRLYKENVMLSLYMNSHSTAPIYTAPDGSTLKLFTASANEMCMVAKGEGSLKLANEMAMFHWVRPNGLGCLLTVRYDENEDQLVIPSVNFNKAGGFDEGQINFVNSQFAPDDKWIPEIVKHIKSFDGTEFEKALKNGLFRAREAAKICGEPLTKVYETDFTVNNDAARSFIEDMKSRTKEIAKRKQYAKAQGKSSRRRSKAAA
ncbi:hypothetical protein [Pseudoalteromonas sp. Of7M-16]|uniref:hypothetical protein n=1 Tax=Pseudoalteromonas sp. Of7M-16 TaxID=2917756 RepID=UPI001EF690B7|nr:hypothetical protein [Pseudoalteromonas sp. Of7M-16]MCG7550910.1 hypothetical protein [Pseudoalteromonas sp. Of7M-16]